MPSTPARRRAPAPAHIDHEMLSNRDLQVRDIEARMALANANADQAKAFNRMAKAIEEGVVALKPAAETVHGFGERLDALCNFLKTKGPWILASIPTVLVAIGAITPSAGNLIKALLTQAGVPH